MLMDIFLLKNLICNSTYKNNLSLSKQKIRAKKFALFILQPKIKSIELSFANYYKICYNEIILNINLIYKQYNH